MKIGMYYNNADVRLENKEKPVANADELLIKVIASGICGSDLMEWYRIKKAPLVLGHEVTGEVIYVGNNVKRFLVGDRVFTTHHVPCDACYYCLSGHTTACVTFQSRNNHIPGGFSEYMKISGRSVISGTFKLPDELSYEIGTFIEPLATVVRGMRAVDLKLGDTVLIIGSGLAGILYVKLAKAMGAGKVIVSDINDYRLQAALNAGANYAVNAKENVAKFVESINGGRLADKVILCTGALPAANVALNCVDRGGTMLFFAVPMPGKEISIDINPFWRNDITFKTSYGAAPLDNMQAMELLRSGAVNVNDMITHRYSLDKIGEAFKKAARPEGTLKVIVRPHG